MFAWFIDSLSAPQLYARAAGAAVVLSLAAGTTRARGDDTRPVAAEANENESEARVLALSDEGSALYERGDYLRALEKFIAAYAIGRDPNLLFNMGRCYQQLGEEAAAEEKYRAFIADGGADPAGVERAKALLDGLYQPTSSVGGAPVTPVHVATPHHTAAAHEPSPLRSIVPWAALGTGIASLTAGATLYLMGAADHGRITGSRGYDDPNGISPLTEARARDFVRSGDTKKTLGSIGLGLGGALLTTSIVLFVTVQNDAPPPSGVSKPGLRLALAPAASGGSVDLIGSF